MWVCREGLLQKRGHVLKNWRTRWVVLEEGLLVYYAAPGGLRKGEVRLRGAHVSAGAGGAERGAPRGFLFCVEEAAIGAISVAAGVATPSNGLGGGVGVDALIDFSSDTHAARKRARAAAPQGGTAYVFCAGTSEERETWLAALRCNIAIADLPAAPSGGGERTETPVVQKEGGGADPQGLAAGVTAPAAGLTAASIGTASPPSTAISPLLLPHELVIFSASWNLAEQLPPPSDFSTLLPPHCDVYALSFQECMHTEDVCEAVSTALLRFSPTRSLASAAVLLAPVAAATSVGAADAAPPPQDRGRGSRGGPFIMLSHRIGATTKALGFHGHIVQAVWVAEWMVAAGLVRLGRATRASVPLGRNLYVTRAGNKGAVAIALPLRLPDAHGVLSINTALVFVACHLTSDNGGKDKIATRNSNARDTITALGLDVSADAIEGARCKAALASTSANAPSPLQLSSSLLPSVASEKGGAFGGSSASLSSLFVGGCDDDGEGGSYLPVPPWKQHDDERQGVRGPEKERDEQLSGLRLEPFGSFASDEIEEEGEEEGSWVPAAASVEGLSEAPGMTSSSLGPLPVSASNPLGVTAAHSYVFLSGDLNYRVNLPLPDCLRAITLAGSISPNSNQSDAAHPVDVSTPWQPLVSTDQLHLLLSLPSQRSVTTSAAASAATGGEAAIVDHSTPPSLLEHMRCALVLPGFAEPPISFPPTYRRRKDVAGPADDTSVGGGHSTPAVGTNVLLRSRGDLGHAARVAEAYITYVKKSRGGAEVTRRPTGTGSSFSPREGGGQDVYTPQGAKETRVPSYTDRCLLRQPLLAGVPLARGGAGGGGGSNSGVLLPQIVCLGYDACDVLTRSDHLAVVALWALPLSPSQQQRPHHNVALPFGCTGGRAPFPFTMPAPLVCGSRSVQGNVGGGLVSPQGISSHAAGGSIDAPSVRETQAIAAAVPPVVVVTEQRGAVDGAPSPTAASPLCVPPPPAGGLYPEHGAARLFRVLQLKGN